MSDNAEGAIKNVCLQFTETGNIEYTRPRKTKQKHNTILFRENTSLCISVQKLKYGNQ